MPDFIIKQNDTEPALKATLEDGEGGAVPVDGASVDFHLKDPRSDNPKVDASATIVDGPNGVVQYEWSSGDTDTPGDYEAEFEVQYGGGGTETFPNNDHIEVRVLGELA